MRSSHACRPVGRGVVAVSVAAIVLSGAGPAHAGSGVATYEVFALPDDEA